MLKNFVRPFALKCLFAFVFSFLAGVSVNALTGNYWVTLNVEETFTRDEAEFLLNKKVLDECLRSPSGNKGRIIAHGVAEYDGSRFVEIEWETPIAGKFKTIRYGKDTFERCVAPVL